MVYLVYFDFMGLSPKKPFASACNRLQAFKIIVTDIQLEPILEKKRYS